jgi:hypothetical protein
MATSGGLTLRASLIGGELAKARLAAVGRQIEPVVRGTLNSTATQARSKLYVAPMLGAFGNRRFLNKSMVVKRANTRRMNARVIPSSSGVGVTSYKSWSFEPIDATRARIFVIGPNGRKMAAGFVNPSSRGKFPLATRSQRARTSRKFAPQITSYRYGWRPGEALGPSIAFWFKQLTTSNSIRWVNTFLQQEFERRIRREIAKYSR